MDRIISVKIMRLQCGLQDFNVDLWIPVWIPEFQCGFWFQSGSFNPGESHGIVVQIEGQCESWYYSVDSWITVWNLVLQYGSSDHRVDFIEDPLVIA